MNSQTCFINVDVSIVNCTMSQERTCHRREDQGTDLQVCARLTEVTHTAGAYPGFCNTTRFIGRDILHVEIGALRLKNNLHYEYQPLLWVNTNDTRTVNLQSFNLFVPSWKYEFILLRSPFISFSVGSDKMVSLTSKHLHPSIDHIWE